MKRATAKAIQAELDRWAGHLDRVSDRSRVALVLSDLGDALTAGSAGECRAAWVKIAAQAIAELDEASES